MLGVGMKSHRGCYNITLLQPTTKQCRLSPEIKHMGAQAAAPNNSAASVGTLGVFLGGRALANRADLDNFAS